ncbi:hypothetical protein MHTCC0001_18670 [Flavobacteriaceae bacterium MHTCC 0001]
MKYFETKHQRDSAKITALVAIIIILLLFVMGPPYKDPPEEYGVAVNFGTSNFGSGKIQPKQPIRSEPRVVEEQPQQQQETATAEPVKATQTKEEVLTEDNAEEIAIKKQKATEAKAKKALEDAKAKAEAERIAKEKAEAEREAKIKREQEAKRKKLDALIGGVSKSDGATGGEGDDNRAGDKGQLDGNPYAPSYFGGQGTGSGGVGYGLNGRGKASFKRLRQDCNESGLVIVRIVVNRSGNVIEATPGVKGTTNNAQCLLNPAKKIALSHKWPANSKAPSRQIGFVSVNFKLSQ